MAEENATTFTPGETRLLMSLIKNLTGDLPSDFAAVANEMGYKDASIARTRWSQIRKKKIIGAGETPSGEGKKATPRKRKAGADGDEATPAKKRGKKAKASAEEVGVKAEDLEENGDDVLESTEAADAEELGLKA